MVSGTAAEEADEAQLDDDNNDDYVQSRTSYARRPQHQECLAEIFQMGGDDLLARLAIKKYSDTGFVPAEVLVTLARSRFGGTARIRGAIALALNERLITEVRYFVNRNPQWYSVMARSSEAAAEAMSDVRLKIFDNEVEISFAEVAFRPFVDKRLMDWFKSQTRIKNNMPSVDGLKSGDDEDGNRLSLAEQVVDDDGLNPEDALQQEQRRKLFERCRPAIRGLREKERTALVLCVIQDMTHKQAGEVMGLGESSVQKYVKSALEALRSGDWHE
jgi:RNA polymerase sigma factor (sigma-70 family)